MRGGISRCLTLCTTSFGRRLVLDRILVHKWMRKSKSSGQGNPTPSGHYPVCCPMARLRFRMGEDNVQALWHIRTSVTAEPLSHQVSPQVLTVPSFLSMKEKAIPQGVQVPRVSGYRGLVVRQHRTGYRGGTWFKVLTWCGGVKSSRFKPGTESGIVQTRSDAVLKRINGVFMPSSSPAPLLPRP